MESPTTQTQSLAARPIPRACPLAMIRAEIAAWKRGHAADPADRRAIFRYLTANAIRFSTAPRAEIAQHLRLLDDAYRCAQ